MIDFAAIRAKAQARFENRVTEGFEYKGFVYTSWEDREPDNCKIFHEVKTPDGKTIDMDWSSYGTPTKAEFQLWIDLGCPRRISCGPLDEGDLEKIQQSRSA